MIEECRAGEQVVFSAHQVSVDYSFYGNLQREIVTHLPDYLARLEKFYAALRDVDDLVNGLFEDVLRWRRKGHVLTTADVAYLRSKKERVESYTGLLCEKHLESLRDLPSDFRGPWGTEPVTEVLSATKNLIGDKELEKPVGKPAKSDRFLVGRSKKPPEEG